MATTATLTLDEFLKQPDTKPGSEYVDGEVVQKAMPTIVHMLIQELLVVVVGGYIRLHGLGISGPEGRCLIGPPGAERGLLPDFLFVAAEHMRGVDLRGPVPRAPDLAVEVLSPDDQMTEVMKKLRFYLAHGVRLVWLIDPDRRTVLVLTPPDTEHLLSEEDTLDGGDVLSGFRCQVRDILPSRELAAPRAP